MTHCSRRDNLFTWKTKMARMERSREFRLRHTKRRASVGKLEAVSERVVALTYAMPCSPSSRRFRAALEGSSIDELNACWRWRVAVQALEAAVNIPPLFYCAPLFVVGTKTGQLVVSKGRTSLTGDSEPSAPHDDIVTIDLTVITACGVLAGQFDKRGGMWHLAYVAFCSSPSVSAPSITVDRALSVIKEPHLMRHLFSNEDEIEPSGRVESVPEGEGGIIREATGELDMGHGFKMDSFLDDSVVDATLMDFKANDREVLQASVDKASSRRTMQDYRGYAYYGRDDDEGRHHLAMLASTRKSPHTPVIEVANSSSGTKWALPGTFTDEVGSKHRDGFSSWAFPCRRGADDHCQSVSPELEESNEGCGIRGGWKEAVENRVNLPEGTAIKGFEDGQGKVGILRSILKTTEHRASSRRAKLHVHWCEEIVDEDPAVKAKREMLAGKWLRSRRGRRVRSPLCSPVGNRPRAFTIDLEDAAIK